MGLEDLNWFLELIGNNCSNNDAAPIFRERHKCNVGRNLRHDSRSQGRVDIAARKSYDAREVRSIIERAIASGR